MVCAWLVAPCNWAANSAKWWVANICTDPASTCFLGYAWGSYLIFQTKSLESSAWMGAKTCEPKQSLDGPRLYWAAPVRSRHTYNNHFIFLVNPTIGLYNSDRLHISSISGEFGHCSFLGLAKIWTHHQTFILTVSLLLKRNLCSLALDWTTNSYGPPLFDLWLEGFLGRDAALFPCLRLSTAQDSGDWGCQGGT